jgi:hypothetical protein
MMKVRLLSTVAASLLIGTGGVYAQSPSQQQAPERAPTTQQNTPAEKVAPPMQNKGSETTGQASPDRNRSPETSGQAPRATDQERSGSGRSSSEPRGTTGQNNPATRSDTNRNATEQNQSPNAQGGTQTQSTTGQGAAAGRARLSSDQRTKITSVIRSEKVERVEPSNLNVSIRVGTRIPSHVRVHRLPAQVVTIYPEWRGYDYILVGDQIVILDPRTHEIVYILEA